MQNVIDSLVHKGKSAFEPGRLINDNIILSTELVKGYERKGVSPRCMLKDDMRKAYDSVKQVLIQLKFPVCLWTGFSNAQAQCLTLS